MLQIVDVYSFVYGIIYTSQDIGAGYGFFPRYRPTIELQPQNPKAQYPIFLYALMLASVFAGTFSKTRH